MSKKIKSDKLKIADTEKAELAAELVIADAEKAERADELVIAKEEIAELADELAIANKEKAKRAAELLIANKEKAKRAAELVIANEEKAKRAAELVIANADKAKRAAELVIARAEKAKRAFELIIANAEKEKREDELIIADKELVYQNEEKAKRAAELVIADINKTKREAELVIANIEKAKRIAKSIIVEKEPSFQTEEKSKRTAELVIADAEKSKCAAEIVIAKIKKAKRAAELVIANIEKAKKSAELVIANKELVYQKSEKSKRKAELIIANVEKSKRAAEIIFMHKELVLAKEKEKLVVELTIVNKELNHQIEKRQQIELALEESNEKYSKAFQSSPSSITILRLEDARYIEVNDTFVSLSGFARKEALSNSGIGINIWVDKEERNSVISALLSGKDVDGKEFQFRKKNGEIRNGLFSAKIIYINKEPHMLSCVDDITQQKQAEENLKESHTKYKVLFDSFPLGITISDKSGNIIESNIKADELLGLTKEEQLKRQINGKEWTIIRTDGSPFPQEEYASVKALKENRLIRNVEMGIVKGENDIRWINVTAAPIPFGNYGVAITYNDITEQNLAKDALQQREHSYRTLSENLPASVYRLFLRERGKMEFFNNVIEQITGYTKDELTKGEICSIDPFIIPEDKPRVMEIVKNAIKNVSEFEVEYRFKQKDGCIGHFYEKGMPIIGEDGKPLYIEGVIFNITERKLAENLLKASEQKSMSIMENSADAIFITNQQGKYVYTNKAVSALLGYTTEEMKSKTIADISPPNKIEEFFKLFKQILNKGRGFTEIELLKKDGNYISTDLNAVVLPDGTIYGSCRDITERKKAESELIKAKEKAEESEYNLNERVKELFGLFSLGLLTEKFKKPEDIYNEFVKTVVPNSMQFPDKVFVALEIADKKYVNIENFNLSINNETLSTPIKIFGKHSGTLTVSYTANLPFIEIYEQNLINAYGERVSKICESFKTRQDLIKAKEKAEESDRLKSAFLTNMSHEIRTPMNGILGFTELLKDPNLSSDELQDFIEIIQISGARMLNTINSIVDMSKIESGLIGVEIIEININEKIEYTYKFFKPEVEIKGLKLSFKTSLQSKEAFIKTDNEKISGILNNLIRNAIKFTFEGSIEFGYEKKGAFLEFYVKDTGVGIPKNQMELIFERFRQGSELHTRDYEGNGLGLSISKSYVEMLGGRIWVESEEGLCTTFYFTIPYNAVLEKNIETISVDSEAQLNPDISRLKILIVEDDEISYSLLSRTLHKISKEVLHANTGAEGVEACRNNPDLDLVLMDIRMPKMDGNEATRQIRQFNKEVIIIAQTAYALAGDSEKAIEAGCNDYITKPINTTLLFELIKKHTNK